MTLYDLIFKFDVGLNAELFYKITVDIGPDPVEL